MTTYRHTTIDNLPAQAWRLYVYATAERINFDESPDEPAETGWVNPGWSLTAIYDSRNDAGATAYASTLEVDPDDDDRATWRDVILEAWNDARRLVPTTITDNGDGTYYGDDDVTVDHASADVYRYALHAELVGPMGRDGADVWHVSGLPTD